MAFIDRLIQEHGLRKINALAAHGEVQGYPAIFVFDPNAKRLNLRLGFAAEPPVELRDLIASLLLIQDVKSAVQKGNRLDISVKQPMKYETLKACLDNVLYQTTTYLRGRGVSGGCMSCGSQDPASLYQTGDQFDKLCLNCYAALNHQMENEFVTKVSKPIRHVPGVIGALLGALVGAAIWMIVYRLGYVAWIVGFVIVMLSLKGYEFFGGRIGKAGMVIGVLFSFAAVLIGNYAGWCWDAYDYFSQSYNVTYFEIFREGIDWLLDPSDRSMLVEFGKNTAFGLGAVLLVGIPFSFSAMKSSSGRTEIRRIE